MKGLALLVFVTGCDRLFQIVAVAEDPSDAMGASDVRPDVDLACAGLFGQRVTRGTDADPYGLTVADMNKDQILDLVVTNQAAGSINVLLNQGDRSFGARVDTAVTGGPTMAVTASIATEADVALAVVAEGAAELRLGVGDGTGKISFVATAPTGTSPYSLAVGSLNGDEYPDIVVGNYASANDYVYLGAEGFQVASPSSIATPAGTSWVALGDFNRDQGLDVALANFDEDWVAVATNGGAGTFGTLTNYPVGVGPNGLVVVDLDGDMFPDIVTANATAMTISILANAGNGTFNLSASVAVGAYPWGIVAADFNADSKQDLALTISGDAQVLVLFGDGNGGFPTRQSYDVGTKPYAIVAADLDVDGLPDLAFVNHDDNTVTALFNCPR